MSILLTILAGIGGTILMTLVMLFIHETEWARADMIRALGGLVTKSYENSVLPGLLIHFTAGAVFAFPYVLVLGGLDVSSIAAKIGIGGLMGFVHGFAMSFILVATVAEAHPVPQFQEAGFEVAVAHIAGHIAYGIGVAVLATVFAIDLGVHF